MENKKKTKKKVVKKTIEERREIISQYLAQIDYLESNKRYQEEEKYLLKVVRLSEVIYQETFSSRDRNALISSYVKISTYYEEIEKRMDMVLRWYQKIIGVLKKSSEHYSTNGDDYYLIDWYIRTIDLLFDFKYYEKIIAMASDMKSVALRVYRTTRTQEDLKKVILAKIYLGKAYGNTGHILKSYYYYNNVFNIMIKIYNDIQDEGIKHDILKICDYTIDLTKKSFLKIFRKKWLVRKMMVEEKSL